MPAAPAGLPVAMEALAAYVPAVSCDRRTSRAAPASARCSGHVPRDDHRFSRACGSDGLSTTEHYDGRAVDWITNVRTAEGKARGDAVVNWLTATDAKGNVAANARRLGVMYIIWNNRIWGAYNPAAGWRPYSGCATTHRARSDTACHRNHVHLSLSWEGAMGRTSWWTKSVAAQDFGPCRVPDLNWAPAYTAFRATACPSYPKVYAAAGASTLYRSLVSYSGMTLRNGSTGPAVPAVQSAVGTGADGGFGPATVTAIQTFQRAHGLAADGRSGSGPGARCSRRPRPSRRRPAADRTTPTRTRRCSTARRAPRSWCCRRRWASASWTATSAPAPAAPSSPSSRRTD